jgi:hypothetical protein
VGFENKVFTKPLNFRLIGTTCESLPELIAKRVLHPELLAEISAAVFPIPETPPGSFEPASDR